MNYKIGVIPGDGTGPEVVAEAVKVLESACETCNISITTEELPYNGSRYIKEKKLLSNAELEDLQNYDALLLGAIGHPDVKPGILEKGILLKLRFGLDQYINFRPVKLYENIQTPLKNTPPENIDYVVVRENTGGLYTGVGGFSAHGTKHEVATQSMVYSRHQIERCVRFAFQEVLNRHQQAPWRGLSPEDKSAGYMGKLTLCGKTNVLTYVYDLWERVFHEIGQEFPAVKRNYVHVDAMCIYMLESPEQFDVIVTGNMFGDIITDLAAVTQGGLGVAAGGNLNPEGVSMFEPIGGTAPQFTGQNVINPMACIGAVQIMMDSLGENDAALLIENAMRIVFKKMKSQRAGEMGYSTSKIGTMVCEQVAKKKINAL